MVNPRLVLLVNSMYLNHLEFCRTLRTILLCWKSLQYVCHVIRWLYSNANKCTLFVGAVVLSRANVLFLVMESICHVVVLSPYTVRYRFCRSVAGPIPPTQRQARHEAGRGLRRPRGVGGQLVAPSGNALRRGTEAAHLYQHGGWSGADESCSFVILLLDHDAVSSSL